MKKLLINSGLIAVLISGILSPAFDASAASTSDTQTVTFQNQSAIQLTLSSGTFDFGAVSPLASPVAPASAELSATVKANAGSWNLAARGPANFRDASTPASDI